MRGALLFLGLFVFSARPGGQTAGAPKAPAAPKGTQQSRELLDRSVQELQKSPEDRTLREKIIKLSLSIKPGLTIPEDARRHYLKGLALQKAAQTPREAEAAVAEFRQALLVAPWWPEAYFNLAEALERAGRYQEAIDTLKLYLVARPGEARKVQDRIYMMEGEQEHARVAAAEKEEQETKERAEKEEMERRRREELEEIEKLRREEIRREQTRRLLASLRGTWRVWACNSILLDCLDTDLLTSSVAWKYNRDSEPLFLGDGTVVIAGRGNSELARLLGTPNGPSADDIMWKCEWRDGTSTPAWVSNFSYNAKGYSMVFTFTCDRNWYERWAKPE
jgi:tetratricopeptide (TPR) repeat protein